jgi:hypothetical protein
MTSDTSGASLKVRSTRVRAARVGTAAPPAERDSRRRTATMNVLGVSGLHEA